MIWIILLLLIVGCNVEKNMTKTYTIDKKVDVSLNGEKILAQREQQQITLRYLGVVDEKQTLEINKIPVEFEIGKPRTINRLFTITMNKIESAPKNQRLIEFSFLSSDGQLQETLEEGKTKRFFVSQREYLISVLSVTDGILFLVNGEETTAVQKGENFVLKNGNNIRVRDIITLDREGKKETAAISIEPA